MSWSSLPMGQSVGVIVPVRVGRTVAPQAGVGVTTVPLLEASGQKEAGKWGYYGSPLPSFPSNQALVLAQMDGWMDRRKNRQMPRLLFGRRTMGHSDSPFFQTTATGSA